MDDFENVILPSTEEGFVELSKTAQGKLFRKNILNVGTLHYNKKKIPITEEFLDHLIDNFESGVNPIVQTTIVNKDNEHTEDPRDNIGEVVDLKREGKKLYAYIDARDATIAPKIGKTILGASAMLSLDYTDTRTDTKAGPTLLHVGMTNRPHVVDLDDFEELIAASAEGNVQDAVFLTADDEEKTPMELDELLATLKVDHNIDVPALQARVAAAEPALALSAKLTEALKGSDLVKLSAGEVISGDEVVGAITKLAEDNVALSNKVTTIETDRNKEKAEARVDALVSTGHILPVKRDANVTLLLSNPETFEALLPEKPIVALSHETGHDEIDLTPEENLQTEIDRIALTSAAKQYIN